MQTDYTFLTDHSYSIRLDNDKLPLKQREMKNKKRRGPSNRSNKTTSTNHTVAIHRSSSDKENNSADASIATGNTLGNKNKSSTKKKTPASRIQSGKKANVKSTQGRIIKKKKSIIKPLDTTDVPASLSIEERVKLRRTKPFLTPPKPVLYNKLQSNIKKSVKQMHLSKAKKTIIKPKKFFLGSGLDLDNIVPGNRQRRSVQT